MSQVQPLIYCCFQVNLAEERAHAACAPAMGGPGRGGSGSSEGGSSWDSALYNAEGQRTFGRALPDSPPERRSASEQVGEYPNRASPHACMLCLCTPHVFIATCKGLQMVSSSAWRSTLVCDEPSYVARVRWVTDMMYGRRGMGVHANCKRKSSKCC